MKPLSLAEFAEIVGGSVMGEPAQAITGFATDSRDVEPGDLFLAIRGANVDGHDFDQQVLSRGAAGMLVEREVMGPHVRVSNLVEALAKFALHFRNQYLGPVVGITGSAGKTTTKEFIASALSPLGFIVKTEGNRNTEYTAPLLWPDVSPQSKAVVIEMAMRGTGQIAHLASFSKPTHAVVTNIGWSHASEVGSRDGIAHAKAELLEALPPDGIAILPADDDYVGLLSEKAQERQIYTFGWSEPADCRIVGVDSLGWEGCTVNGFFADIPWQAFIPYVGKHLATNVAAAICTAATLGLAPQEAAEVVGDALLPPMRMEVIVRDGIHILLDAYNASPASMTGAIETFAGLPVDGRRYAILGQMNELGATSADEHRKVGEFIKGATIHKVVGYGPLAADYGLSVATSIDDLKAFYADLKPGDAILIKGSRSLELERVLS